MDEATSQCLIAALNAAFNHGAAMQRLADAQANAQQACKEAVDTAQHFVSAHLSQGPSIH